MDGAGIGPGVGGPAARAVSSNPGGRRPGTEPMRGVCYLVWGDTVGPTLDRSMASVRRFHPDLPIHVERLQAPDPVGGLLLKAQMFRLSPFPTTLYLDADTVVPG